MILLIDNYDSFVHNLARYLCLLGQDTCVVRNDAMTLSEISKLNPSAIVLSPGPGTPEDAGISLELVKHFQNRFPILGVCLGHQVIARALGASIVRAKEPMHGRTSIVSHQASPLFAEIPTRFTVCRYHSLIVDPQTLPAELNVTAKSEDGTIMAIEHNLLPLVGVQFHPEASLTTFGFHLLANFLAIAGIKRSTNCSLDELPVAEVPLNEQEDRFLPVVPVTF